MKKIVVIGGGAAGIMASYAASISGCEVILLERNSMLGRKIRITGKGRCNITSSHDVEEIIKNIYNNGRFMYSSLYSFTNDDLVYLLNENGLKTKVERGGRIFPESDKAIDVVNTLLRIIDKDNISIRTGARVRSIIVEDIENNIEDTFSNNIYEENPDKKNLKVKDHAKERAVGVELFGGEKIFCDAVILATGGKSYPLTGSTGDGYDMVKRLGHKVTRLSPSLVGMEVRVAKKHIVVNDDLSLNQKTAKEIKIDAKSINTHDTKSENNSTKIDKKKSCFMDIPHSMEKLNLRNIGILMTKNGKKIYEDFGELYFREYGIDGPVIKSASCFVDDDKNDYRVFLDLKPALDYEKLDRRIQRDFEKYSNKNFENSLNDLLPRDMIDFVIDISGIDRKKKVHQITKEEREILLSSIKNIEFVVESLRPIDEAIVTSGGISVKEINPSTMESKIVDSLFIAGEVIDVDGFTGGFNLQIAFSTGYLAGLSASVD